ncbi:MAG: 1-deoxy-D-xylulose-5-phosphate reductoisomerase [Planctomycetota bacterium]|nr:1-deoxy-D-xylulose-5-phosphate reductoisomerase [Planctomycetota bacterium]
MSVPRRVILLGSTGSIGESTLDVIRHMNGMPGTDFDLVGLAAGSRHQQLLEQAAEFGVGEIALADASRAEGVDFKGRMHVGPGSACALVESIAREGDLVVAAIVGSAGIEAVLAAIDAGCDVALANKETLVAAGTLVIPRARERGIHLLPVDSEHSAIFQCLQGLNDEQEIRRLVITASGGPFRGMDRDTIRKATPEQALAHPTWSMGPKITIDSASMMNKALEVIEAHWLFDLPADKIDVIVHPQSIIHGFVEYVDGSVLAQLGPPDMKTPIQYAMTWPRRVEGCSKRMDWSELRSLIFEPLDHAAFPPVKQALEVIRQGGTAGAVFNAANEVAVEAFLAHAIPFGGIHDLVAEAIDAIPAQPIQSLSDITSADEQARTFVRGRIAELTTTSARATTVSSENG